MIAKFASILLMITMWPIIIFRSIGVLGSSEVSAALTKRKLRLHLPPKALLGNSTLLVLQHKVGCQESKKGAWL